MPSADVYGKRELMAVDPINGSNWKYGFNTNSSSSERTDLGQTPGIVNGAYIAGLVLGANFPKPARMKRDSNGGGIDTSYASWDKIDSARGAGWTLISLPKFKLQSHTKSAKKVFVDMRALDGQGQPTGVLIKYSWTLPLFLYNKITAALTGLGIELADPKDKDLIIAPRFPVPPRARQTIVDANGRTETMTTFCSPAKLDNLPTGWAAVT